MGSGQLKLWMEIEGYEHTGKGVYSLTVDSTEHVCLCIQSVNGDFVDLPVLLAAFLGVTSLPVTGYVLTLLGMLKTLHCGKFVI